MHRPDRWPEEEQETQRSRQSSRRNSSSSRRNSLKKEKEAKKTLSSAPPSATSTPKKTAKPQNMDFVVTGKQILKRSDRANSLPGSYHRRPSSESLSTKKKSTETKRVTNANAAHSSKSQETSLEDDMSLDLSQVSDFEDTNSKYGIQRKFQALATSTPKPLKPRSASLQSQIHSQRVETRRVLKSLDSTKQSFNHSRDSFKTSTSSSPYRYGTELDYSSVSPEYSGQSSVDLSPTRASRVDAAATPRSQEMQVSSGCISSWADVSELDTKVEDRRRYDHDGEWSSFWANYNNSLAKVPMKSYYDQCPTPYRTETFDLQDFEFSTEGSRKRSPDNIDTLNHIIRNQGLHLTPRETQNIIKCAHLLGNVLSKAIERRSKASFDDSLIKDPEITSKKKNLTLDLKETTIPVEAKEEKKSETVTTQTDISLPNTKSAPRIFENILRQLSRSSIDVGVIQNKEKGDSKDKIEAKDKKDTKSDAKDKNEVKGEVNNQVKDKNEVKDKKDTKCDAKDKNEEKSKLNDQMKDKNEVTDKKNTKSDATDKNEVKSGVKNQVLDKSKVTGEVTEVKDQNEVKSEVKNEIENKPEVTEVKDKKELKTDTKNKE